MNIAALFQAIVFVTFITYVINQKGIIRSISNSWYALEKKGYLFAMFAFGMGIPMFFYSYFGFEGYSDIVFMLAAFTMSCVGISATTKSSKEANNIHNLVTVSTILLSFLGIYLQFNDWHFLAGGAIGTILISIFCKENKLWWIELWVFTVIMAKLIPNGAI